MSVHTACLVVRALLALVLAGAAVGAARAAPEDTLLDALAGEVRRPQLRCEWVAARFPRADRMLSLYREELASLFVDVDGTRVAGSGRGGLRRIEFEARLFGPSSATVSFDVTQAPALARTRPGAQLEIGFADRRGVSHPLFCGIVATLRRGGAPQLAEIVGLLPRTGHEGARSARYTDMTRVDVLQRVTTDAGLQLELQDTQPHPVLPVIARRDMADWPYLRSLARSLRMELTLRSDGRLLATPGTFAPPLPPARAWSAMTWVEIAGHIAAEAGRGLDAQLTAPYPRIDRRQVTTADEMLADLAADHEASAWWSGDRLLLREDGVWSRHPAAQDAPATTLTPQQLAATIAARHGLALRAAPLAAAAVTVARSQETDAQLLLRVLGMAAVRVDARAGILYLQAARAPGDVKDLLLQRIAIAGSAARERRFERRHGDTRAQLLDPEGVATTEVRLDLGTLLAPAAPAATPLADGGDIAVELNAALGRLAAQPVPAPPARFLQDFARSHRPTLLHLYRLRPDGAAALRVIAAPP